MFSESTQFFEQPKVITLMDCARVPFVFNDPAVLQAKLTTYLLV